MLKSEKKHQIEIMTQTKSAKARARAEFNISDLEEEMVGLERMIASLEDILPGLHAEFETRCNEKIAQVANAVKDPSSWDVSMPPAAVQPNAQPLPEPLASKWDPITSSGGAEPCECKSQMVNAQSSEMDAHLPRPSKSNSLKKPNKKKKTRKNYRYSSHCGGKQVKWGGNQNAGTSCPDIGNPVIEVHTNKARTSFKYRDGSMAPLNLVLDDDEPPSVFKVPVGQVAQVIIHHESTQNFLCGISMVDRKGNTLFKTWDDKDADASHTISLEEGESIVGFRSHAGNDGKKALHWDFQLIIAKMVEVEVDEE